MQKIIISFIVGLGAGFFAVRYFIYPSNFSPVKDTPTQKLSIKSTKGLVDTPNGNIYTANYRALRVKPFGDTVSFFIDSAGFKELIKDNRFKGFHIYLGIKETNNPRDIQLLFAGARDSLRGDSPVLRNRRDGVIDTITVPYFVRDLNKRGEYSYLDKIGPCPGSPNCPPGN
jgi:hypothetical protein